MVSLIVGSSLNPPPEKTFVLDDKERTVHFIDDKAIVLMDDNVPRELTFKDEQREVYIDGMVSLSSFFNAYFMLYFMLLFLGMISFLFKLTCFKILLTIYFF